MHYQVLSMNQWYHMNIWYHWVWHIVSFIVLSSVNFISLFCVLHFSFLCLCFKSSTPSITCCPFEMYFPTFFYLSIIRFQYLWLLFPFFHALVFLFKFVVPLESSRFHPCLAVTSGLPIPLSFILVTHCLDVSLVLLLFSLANTIVIALFQCL